LYFLLCYFYRDEFRLDRVIEDDVDGLILLLFDKGFTNLLKLLLLLFVEMFDFSGFVVFFELIPLP
jgi:hypothetical protein